MDNSPSHLYELVGCPIPNGVPFATITSSPLLGRLSIRFYLLVFGSLCSFTKKSISENRHWCWTRMSNHNWHSNLSQWFLMWLRSGLRAQHSSFFTSKPVKPCLYGPLWQKMTRTIGSIELSKMSVCCSIKLRFAGNKQTLKKLHTLIPPPPK